MTPDDDYSERIEALNNLIDEELGEDLGEDLEEDVDFEE